jgi:RimJ/RimL family protein N-acetyltransferase
MSEHVNHLGQAIGFPLPGWTARPRPPRTAMEGRYCTVEPFDLARDAAELHAAYLLDKERRNWTYLPYGPFPQFDDYRAWLERACLGDDPLVHAIIERSSGRAAGVASLMRIDPPAGVIEVGGINYAPSLQRTPAATESMYLLMRRVFDELGYRRYEWKCDALNAPSRAAAQRLGFRYEGMFRQATVTKMRNRDTCWFSILDSEWPALKAAFERWLDPSNFDTTGRQRQSLSSCR